MAIEGNQEDPRNREGVSFSAAEIDQRLLPLCLKTLQLDPVTSYFAHVDLPHVREHELPSQIGDKLIIPQATRRVQSVFNGLQSFGPGEARGRRRHLEKIGWIDDDNSVSYTMDTMVENGVRNPYSVAFGEKSLPGTTETVVNLYIGRFTEDLSGTDVYQRN